MDYKQKLFYRNPEQNMSKVPFYMAYPMQTVYMEELEYARDLEKLKGMYPKEIRSIQEMVEDECDKMEYEGSMMYDEYPDKWQIYRLTQMITDKIKGAGEEGPVEEDWNKTTEFVQILLCYEIYRRRHCNNNGILKF